MAPATTRRSCLITAVVIAVAISGYAAWRFVDGVVPSAAFFRVYSFVMAILVISWLVTDPKLPATHRPSFDHGALVWATFPLLAAYHMFVAHRWRGILVVLGLSALLAAPNIVLALIYVVG